MWHSSGSGDCGVCSGALRSSSNSLVATGPVLVLVLCPDHITYDAARLAMALSGSSGHLHTKISPLASPAQPAHSGHGHAAARCPDSIVSILTVASILTVV